MLLPLVFGALVAVAAFFLAQANPRELVIGIVLAVLAIVWAARA